MNTDKLLESNVQSLINRADQKHQLGKLDEAESIYRQVLQIQPAHGVGLSSLEDRYYVRTIASLANVLQDQGKLEAAVAAYQEALKIKPDLAEVHNNLANVLRDQDKLEAAVAAYQEALKIKPNFAQAHNNLGNVLQDQGKLEAAVAAYQKAIKIKPDFAQAKLGLCMSQLPIVYSCFDEIKLRRNNYQEHLQNLAQSYQAANPNELAKAAEAVGSSQPFLLAYQGLNDRSLQQMYGEMICQLMSSRYPQWSQSPAIPSLKPNEKVRVGVISGFFRNHSNWKMPIRGWVENLDRDEFELFGYHTGLIQDRETAIASQSFVKFTQGPLPIKQWCEVIKQDQLHILILPEFGMDSMTVQLGCLRLAPIQISTALGHPVTSGLPTMDYCLGSDLMEPENAQDHYTEKLVRLPNLAFNYMPLSIEPKAISKKEIGVENDEVMFWCCQSLFKYLPQHDDVFPRIARELASSKFVFLANSSERVTEVFRQRLNRAFQEFGLDYEDHCIFLPKGWDSRSFAGTAAIADVYLDSIGWSGGNTSIEAIAYNKPVVTLPGDIMRGRVTMAFLRMMGIEETIAASKDDYVKIAVRLGRDPQYHQHISKQVAENKHKLYGDLKPVRALEDFLLNAVHKKRFNMATVSEGCQLPPQHPQVNRLTKAEQAYRKMLETQPEHPDALYGLGVVAQQRGDYQAAEDWLNAALRVQPESVKAWFSLGNLRQAQDQLPEAIEAYHQALAIQPDLAAIHNNLGYALQHQGKLEEAIACYQKALEIQPDCTEADVSWGNVLYAQGKLSPEKYAHYAAANYMLGVNQQRQEGNLKVAIVCYRQAIAMQPDLAIAHYNLGVALEKQGQLKEALACYQRAQELNPNYAEV